MNEYTFKQLNHSVAVNQKQGLAPQGKELAPFRAKPSLQRSTPLKIVTLLRKTTGSLTSTFLSLEEARPSQSLRPLQPRINYIMSPRGENRGPTDHEPTAPRISCKNSANWRSAFYLYVYISEWAGDVWTTLTQRLETPLAFSQRQVDIVPSSNFQQEQSCENSPFYALCS